MPEKQNVILLRYGELHLKGKNRDFFEGILKSNIKVALKEFALKLEFGRSRYIVYDYDKNQESAIIKTLKMVFGLHSLSVAKVCQKDSLSIFQACAELINDEYAENKTFRINAHRADKQFPLNSIEICRDAGAYVLSNCENWTVDLHNPSVSINIDIRDSGDNNVFVFSNIHKCAGGMPVSSAGKGMLMLSGGIDSPVSAFMMAKRGLKLKAVHFASPPYTSEFARQKVLDLCRKIARFNGATELFIVPFTKVQEAIHEKCDSSFMITLMRRIMVRISNILCEKNQCKALVTGESLGQVASQTMESLTATNSVSVLPVLRPLIAFDKEEIIDIARKIDTFDISIRPYDDCCTVFLPKNPQTKPRESRILFEESKLEIDSLIEDAVASTERLLAFCDNVKALPMSD